MGASVPYGWLRQRDRQHWTANTFSLVMFTVNRLTENFLLTDLSINRTETGNMATALSAKKITFV